MSSFSENRGFDDFVKEIFNRPDSKRQDGFIL
jgi:hypothetical protein